MAQAARLNLRMQKELKLLLAEPPPAASFPLLSSDSNFSSFSLSSIDALIEGPEGTVYEKRLFKIKIQIPERYPFQPPTVTFNTPIYHPNIDNGGRICLDILNLPPKGAWQPSLNISTVLTSIGLLLSEPNPDDGLMCDASREYKYNRQAFDEKARSMTQKFGMVGARGDSSGCNSLQSNLNSNTIEAQTSETTKCDESNLPLGFSESNEKPNHMEIELEKQESKDMLNEGHPKYERGQKSRLKLSLESFGPSQFVRGDDKENVVLNQNLSPSTSQSVSTTSTKSINTGQRSGYNYEKQQMVPQDFNKQAREDYSKKNETALANPKRKKLGLTGKKLPLGLSRSCHSLENSNKENSTLTQTIPISHPSNISKSEVSGCFDDKTVKCSTNLDQRKLGIGRTLSLKPLSRVQRTSDAKSQLQLHSEGDEIHHGDKEESPAPEAVIVLDSEESEEERDGPLRSKLILARKRLPKKWRAQK